MNGILEVGTNDNKDMIDSGTTLTPSGIGKTTYVENKTSSMSPEAKVVTGSSYAEVKKSPEAVANNTYNQQQKALADTKNTESSVGSIFEPKSATNEYNTGGAQQWTPSFAATDTGAISTERRSATRKIADDMARATLYRQGLVVKQQKQELRKQEEINKIMFGGSEGGITATGLLAAQKAYGDQALHSLMADNRITLADVEVKAEQLRMTADAKYVESLDAYIEEQQSINKEGFMSMVYSGSIATISQEETVKRAKNAGISPEEAISMRTAVVAGIDGTNSAENLRLEKLTNAVYRKTSPPGILMKGNTVGGRIDENGIYRFAKPTNVKRMQCGAWVNDALGFRANGKKQMGDKLSQKISMGTSDHPIQLGFFVSGKEPWGHTGVVEAVYTIDGKDYMEIAESNINGVANTNEGKEKFGRSKLVAIDDTGKNWKDVATGRIRSFHTFGPNGFEKDEPTQTPVQSMNNNLQASHPILSQVAGDEVLAAESKEMESAGFSRQEVSELSDNAKRLGTYQNAYLAKIFNDGNVPLPQSLLDAQPRDKVEMTKTLLDLYNKDAPAFAYQTLESTGQISENVANQFVEETKIKEKQASDAFAYKQQLEQDKLNLSIQKYEADSAIKAEKLKRDKIKQYSEMIHEEPASDKLIREQANKNAAINGGRQMYWNPITGMQQDYPISSADNTKLATIRNNIDKLSFGSSLSTTEGNISPSKDSNKSTGSNTPDKNLNSSTGLKSMFNDLLLDNFSEEFQDMTNGGMTPDDALRIANKYGKSNIFDLIPARDNESKDDYGKRVKQWYLDELSQLKNKIDSNGMTESVVDYGKFKDELSNIGYRGGVLSDSEEDVQKALDLFLKNKELRPLLIDIDGEGFTASDMSGNSKRPDKKSELTRALIQARELINNYKPPEKKINKPVSQTNNTDKKLSTVETLAAVNKYTTDELMSKYPTPESVNELYRMYKSYYGDGSEWITNINNRVSMFLNENQQLTPAEISALAKTRKSNAEAVNNELDADAKKVENSFYE